MNVSVKRDFELWRDYCASKPSEPLRCFACHQPIPLNPDDPPVALRAPIEQYQFFVDVHAQCLEATFPTGWRLA